MLRIVDSKKKLLFIGHYKVLKVLYSDTAKDIYCVRESRKPFRYLTLKILKPKQSPVKINQEIEILHILNHYNGLAKFYDIEIVQDKLLFMFDYINGHRLDTILQNKPMFFNNKNIKQFILNMVYILGIYNKHKILHNNIKLDNILYDGKRYHLLGFSKASIVEKDYDLSQQNDMYLLGKVLYSLVYKKTYTDGVKVEKNSSMESNVLEVLDGLLNKTIKLSKIIKLLT